MIISVTSFLSGISYINSNRFSSIIARKPRAPVLRSIAFFAIAISASSVMVNLTYTESNFAYTYSGVPEYVAYPDTELNNLLRETAKENNIDLKEANCFCTDWFDKYVDDIDKAACLLSVVDTVNDGESVAPEKREQALNDMIVTALETAIKL